MSGDKETGITFMLMDEGLDTGKIIKKFPIKIVGAKMQNFFMMNYLLWHQVI